MPALVHTQWPERLKRSFAVKGVFVGGGVARGDGSRFRAKAHAHSDGRFAGWICYLSPKRLDDEMLAIHELAHLVSDKRGHCQRWREAVIRLGGTLDPTNSLRLYRGK